jgi:hypothetical protein
MSSAVVSTPAANGRLFAFDAEAIDSEAVADLRSQTISTRQFPGSAMRVRPGMADPRLAGIIPASRLELGPLPQMVSTGIPAIDALAGGLPRGCLTEICGQASSGCTTLLLSALAAATRRGEYCAVVDANDVLDPQSTAVAGVQLEKLLWVRCGGSALDSPQSHRDTKKKPRKSLDKNRGSGLGWIESQQRLEQVLLATDLLLDSGGFGMIALDLGDLPPQAARYIPLTTWFRFRRTVERTPTVLLVIEQQPIAGSCSSLLLKLGPANGNDALIQDCMVHADRDSPLAHSQLLTGMNLTAELLRARPQRKPALSASVAFSSKTAWAG